MQMCLYCDVVSNTSCFDDGSGCESHFIQYEVYVFPLCMCGFKDMTITEFPAESVAVHYWPTPFLC